MKSRFRWLVFAAVYTLFIVAAVLLLVIVVVIFVVAGEKSVRKLKMESCRRLARSAGCWRFGGFSCVATCCGNMPSCWAWLPVTCCLLAIKKYAMLILVRLLWWNGGIFQ